VITLDLFVHRLPCRRYEICLSDNLVSYRQNLIDTLLFHLKMINKVPLSSGLMHTGEVKVSMENFWATFI
jgi:hypothetical protein